MKTYMHITFYIYMYMHLVGIFDESSTKIHGTENFKIGQSFIEHWGLTDYVQLRSVCNIS